MKNNHYPQSEIENLSAYLDHELTGAEEAQLRSRLAEDAKLRETLEDLRLTRYTLQHTPKVRRQRSFVLTPEMVRQQKAIWRAFSFSRTIAVAASVLFALVMGGQVLLGSGVGMLSATNQENFAMDVYDDAAMDEAEAPMMMQAASEDEITEESAATTADDSMMADNGTNVDTAGAAPEEAAAEEPAAEMAPTPTETLAPQPTMDMTNPPAGGGGPPPTETTPTATETMKMPAPTDEGQAEDMPAALPDEGDLGAGDTRIAEGDRIMQDESMAEDTALTEPVRQPIPTIRWVEIGLLALAVIGAGLTIYFRRKVF
ncbi:hypothetical protein KQH61_04370 [bacterium]|nr:hypothetical protein [bacterium]MCB2179139.1 hypothetical protein [bacterium]